jgi:hypothetical protein
MRFEVFMAVKIHIAVFWIMTPCSLVGGYQHIGETFVPIYQTMWCYNEEDYNMKTSQFVFTSCTLCKEFVSHEFLVSRTVAQLCTL